MIMAESEKGPAKPNRLIHEKSPYLLQHAGNPVDWYPWKEEAFEKATVYLGEGYPCKTPVLDSAALRAALR